MEKLKPWLKFAAIVGGLYILFAIAEFSSGQAFLLAVCFTFVITAFREHNQKTETFEPFFISVSPNWYKILVLDHKAITEAQWEIFEKKMQHEDPDNVLPKFKLFKYGLHLTFLKPDSSLIYVYHRNNFVSEIDIYEDIFPREMLGLKIFEGGIRFYMCQRMEGYELGIVTLESFKKSVLPDMDDARIPLATLPYSAFSLMYNRNLTVAAYKKGQENLKKHGWKEEVFDTEPWEHLPFQIEHPDFTVAYNTI